VAAHHQVSHHESCLQSVYARLTKDEVKAPGILLLLLLLLLLLGMQRRVTVRVGM
jgi:hypothetical protein